MPTFTFTFDVPAEFHTTMTAADDEAALDRAHDDVTRHLTSLESQPMGGVRFIASIDGIGGEITESTGQGQMTYTVRFAAPAEISATVNAAEQETAYGLAVTATEMFLAAAQTSVGNNPIVLASIDGVAASTVQIAAG
jgi:hypothetical protein